MRLSAAEGRADAQYNLGTMFDGQGATSDPQEAARNYREAANQGHASAQFNLGNMYRKGLGVEKSYVEAARLYKAAGASKHKKAQANLDHLLQKGYVTEEDLIVPDVDEESKTYAYIYLAVMALLLLVIPSRILKGQGRRCCSGRLWRRRSSRRRRSRRRGRRRAAVDGAPARRSRPRGGGSARHLERREAGAGVSSVFSLEVAGPRRRRRKVRRHRSPDSICPDHPAGGPHQWAQTIVRVWSAVAFKIEGSGSG